MNDQIDEITFDDCPQGTPPPTKNPIDYLPPELRERAAKLPPGEMHTLLELKEEGEGHNASLLHVAATCFKMGVSFDDTLAHLREAYATDRMDYETAPKRAVVRVWQAEGDLTKLVDDDAQAAPDAKEELLLRFRRTASSELVEVSPGNVKVSTLEILERLFKPDDILNIQRGALEKGDLVKLSDLPTWLGKSASTIDEFKFLNPANFKNVDGVPNPTTENPGKISKRCNDNVKARRWMVLEMDSKEDADLERFNSFVVTMALHAPLVLAVDTGNKSIHFWFDAEGAKPQERRTFFNIACLHGADPRMAVKSQIARMPNVSSAKQGRGPQTVVYYDPTGLGHPQAGWDLKGFERFLRNSQQLEYFYNGDNKSFLTRDNNQTWVSLDRTSLRAHLQEKGFRATPLEGENITPVEEQINRIQLDKSVEAVLAGASGRHAGLYEENGHRVIVKKSPKFIKPRQIPWPTIQAFLEGLLDHEPDQLEVFFGWCADSIKKLRNGGRRRAVFGPCQMLHIAGPPNSGKTLLLKDILTVLFSGRIASADPLFRKFASEFNSEMFGAELLYLDDSPVLETNYAFRQEFGERIKSAVVGVGGNYRQMRQDRLNMRPWWRFVRLMNLEPQILATLPPMNEGIEDKLILLRGEDMEKGPLGKEMKVPGWYERIERRIKEEIPGFIHFLLEEFELSERLRDPKQRFPTVSFKSPELLCEIAQGSLEEYLLHRLDHEGQNLFSPGMSEFNTDKDAPEIWPWTGTAETLYDAMCLMGHRGSQARFVKTCPSPRVLMSQLRNLEKSHPHRVGYSKRLPDWATKKDGVEYWVIFPADMTKLNFADVDPDLEDLL